MRTNYMISVVTWIMVGLMIMAVGLVSNATAAITSTSGTVVFESNPFPPAADDQVFVFDEQQGVPFVGTQPLDFGSIPPGTLVDSHYIQYDPLSYPAFVGTGSVTFDGPIIGVITTSANLYAGLSPEVSGTSDTYFGLEALLGPYPTGVFPTDRGLGSPEDDLIFEIGSNTLTVESLDIPVAGNIDCIRVITLAPIAEEVEIDIRPGSFLNSINPNAGGVIPVAILTTDTFDASMVNPETVELEGASARGKGKSGRYGSLEDVDGDGDLDLVVQIENVIEWDPAATEATVTGMTWDGIPIQGTDTVNIVPPE